MRRAATRAISGYKACRYGICNAGRLNLPRTAVETLNSYLQLLTTLENSSAVEMSQHRSAIANIIDIHTETLVAVAFARSYNGTKWQDARNRVLEFISNVFDNDVRDISHTITCLGKYRAGSTSEVHTPTIRKPMWKKAFETLQPNDADRLGRLITIVAGTAHLDVLNKVAFVSAFRPPEGPESFETAFDELNLSLTAIHSGFAEALSKYPDYNVSSVLDLLRKPGVVKAIMLLMLSPNEGLQAAAQNLVGQAFDVDVRLDCFRALLENVPDASIEGIFDFLDAFTKYAPTVPEACSVSKSLVRCLTDIIEVLCASHNGLLRNPRFMRPTGAAGPAAKLPKFWSLMTKSIAVIFNRTPSWSLYFPSETMIVWMRDALIFGRDMLAQRRVIEAAAVNDPQQSALQSPKKLSPIGRKMVDNLQEVLPELARWLRLTDEELLHQSFSLLQSLLDCFRENDIPPSPAGIAKLNKYIKDARQDDQKTRLDSNRLSQLENALASIDDEIQIISYTRAPKRNRTEEKPKIKSTPTSRVDDVKADTSKSSMSRFFKPRFFRQYVDAEAPKTSFPRSESPSTLVVSKPSKRVESVSKGESSARTTSAEESSSDSGSEGEKEPRHGLASLGKLQLSPKKIRKQVERRQVKMIESPVDRVKSMQDEASRRENARRTALRLKQDVSGLHRAILSWNYDYDGPDIPNVTKSSLVRVPDRFSDHDQYLRVFQPLLLLECWSQIMQSKDEIAESYEMKITSKQYTDDWLDIEITISDSVKKDWYLMDTDVVLVRHLDRKKCILAKVRSYTARPWGISASLRLFFGVGSVDPGLVINSSWRLSKVFR